MKVILISLIILVASYLSCAQRVDTTKTAVPNNGFLLTAYIEAYYLHDFTAPKIAQERPAFLYNHRRNREVTINLAFAKLAYTSGRVRGNLALQVGTYPQYNYAAEQKMMRAIFEANAGVKVSKIKNLWLDAGIFASHIGFEGAISKDCWTLTRSILAENSPYYLSGVKLTYNTLNDKWTLLGMVTTGWQRIQKVLGYSGPSLTTQVQYRPSSTLTLNWSSFLGSDRPDSLQQRRFFNNFYAIINPMGRVGVILGADIGIDSKRTVRTGVGQHVNRKGSYIWYSPVVIARYKMTTKSCLNGRVEYYDDKKAVIVGIPDFQIWGYSLGYDHAILPNALFRVEGKVYNGKTPIFKTLSSVGRSNASLATSLAISF